VPKNPTKSRKVIHNRTKREHVRFADASVVKILDCEPVPRFDTRVGPESWFYIKSIDQFRALISDSETIHEGFWRSPGWYHTLPEQTDRGRSWLALRPGDVERVMSDREVFAASDARQIRQYIEKLNKRK